MNKITFLFFLLTTVLIVNSYSHGRYNNKVVQNCFFNICQQIPDYPADKINKIIKNNTFLHSYFGQVFQHVDPEDSYRKKRSNKNECSCTSTNVKIAPRLIQDVDNIGRIIANVDHYRQMVDFEICNDDQACCMQKFETVELVAVNVDDEKAEIRPFQVPSHCG